MTYPCKYKYDGYHGHNGEYWYRCTVCGAEDWVGYSSDSYRDHIDQMRDCKRKNNHMKVIKAPHPFKDETRDKFTIFLGGSIEMGDAENWQERLTNDLSKYSDQLVLLNPRRDDWDSTWAQDPTPGTKFYEQVSWEMDAQEGWSDLIVYYFAPGTKSPITLLELGSYGSRDPYNTIVCCPPDFWRYGNVYMFCEEHNIPFTDTYEDMLFAIEKRLGDRSVY